jgi:hypothetical protein
MDIARTDKQRRHLFFYLCMAFGIPVIIGFLITDYFEGDTIELIVDGFTGSILVAALLGIRIYGADLLVYRLGLILLSLSFFWGVAIGSGNGTLLYWFYMMPLFFLFFLGKFEGSLGTIIFLTILAILLINPLHLAIYPYDLQISIRFLVSLVFVSIMAYGLEFSRQWFSELLTAAHDKLVTEKKQLEEALNNIQILRGLLPMCANCKKIRDHQGDWQPVEVYLSQRSEVEFSHGICPECKAKLYPEIYSDDI